MAEERSKPHHYGARKLGIEFKLTIGAVYSNSLLDRSCQVSGYGRIGGRSHHASSQDWQPFDQSKKDVHDAKDYEKQTTLEGHVEIQQTRPCPFYLSLIKETTGG